MVAVIGCGTVSYKAGGSDYDYRAARDRCHKQGRRESPDFDLCMEEQGWISKQLAPARDATESPAPAETPSPDVAPAPGVGGDAGLGPGDATPTDLGDAAPVEAPTEGRGWFKFGGTAAELATAKKRCASKLGEADRGEPESQQVTGAMLDCLRSEGWRAF